VVKVNIETGERQQVHPMKEYFRTWIVDRNHQVRVGIRYEKGNYEIHVSDPDGKNWRLAWKYHIRSDKDIWPLGFGKDPNILYVGADHEGRDAIFTVDLRDPELKLQLKLAHDEVDLSSGLRYSKLKKDVVGINTAFNGEKDTRFWDAEYKTWIEMINGVLPNRFNFLGSMSDDENHYLVYSGNSATSTEIYLGNLNTQSLDFYTRLYPDLPQESLVAKKKSQSQRAMV